MDFFTFIECKKGYPMPDYHLNSLNRKEYIASVETIEDTRTVNFANMSMEWWDKHFGWYKNSGCVVLCDEENVHLSYIFYKIDRYNEYLTIHNIFTPLNKRRKGYAHALMTAVFKLATLKKVCRFKLSSISNSLDFYLSLGFVYWGLTSAADYYCDLPIPKEGLSGVEQMTQSENIEFLCGNSLQKICSKVEDNEKNLNQKQELIYQNDCTKLGESYLLKELMITKEEH